MAWHTDGMIMLKVDRLIRYWNSKLAYDSPVARRESESNCKAFIQFWYWQSHVGVFLSNQRAYFGQDFLWNLQMLPVNKFPNALKLISQLTH